MKKFWFLIYNWLFIPAFWLILKIAGFFNAKVRKGINGRRSLFDDLSKKIKALPAKNRIWFHSSSMGEFEQAKPIIASLKRKRRDISIIVTFFSPSGYDNSKYYRLADLITYIPFDTKRNARRFLDLLDPEAAIFVRYDIWPNHLWELRSRRIPAFIANATMRESSARFYPLIKNFHKLLFDNFTAILTVSDKDAETFSAFGMKKPEIESIGDTRYDQVWQRSTEARKRHLIPTHILGNKKVLVAGSTWPEDEEVIVPAVRKLLQYDAGIILIIVPHEPTLAAIEKIEIQLGKKIRSLRFSALNDFNGERIIIVDSVGILMPLYQYAELAYVGGSFKQGVHNVLEPSVYGIPVIYGPRHLNSQEAVELAKMGGGFVINDQQECYRTMRTLLGDKKARLTAGNEALKLVKKNIGATERFIEHLLKVI
jgi:3-deoxy-D-manno-octulosonic-acid transferase